MTLSSSNCDAGLRRRGLLLVLLIGGMARQPVAAQFVDSFEKEKLGSWETQTGDGQATMDLSMGNGHAVVSVDATEDRHNICWAILRQDASGPLMEFDVPDTTGWQTLSMATDGVDGRPGNTVNMQLALVD